MSAKAGFSNLSLPAVSGSRAGRRAARLATGAARTLGAFLFSAAVLSFPAFAGERELRTLSGEELRRVVREADPGDVIRFAPGLEGTVRLDGTLSIGKNLEIRGPGREKLSLDGDLDTAVRVEKGAEVRLSGLAVRNGENGVEVLGGRLVLEDAAVVDNVHEGVEVDEGGYVELLRSVVRENGGIGIACEGGGTVLLRRSAVVEQSIDDGIHNSGCVVRCENSTLSENDNGIVNDEGGVVFLHNCTVAGNHNTGIENAGGKVSLSHTVLAEHMAENCSGPILSQGHNLSDDDTCPLSASGDRLGVEAGLEELRADARGNWVRPPSPESPLVDAGDPGGCLDVEGNPLREDQRGSPRPATPGHGKPVCDVGAVELQPPRKSLWERLRSWFFPGFGAFSSPPPPGTAAGTKSGSPFTR